MKTKIISRALLHLVGMTLLCASASADLTTIAQVGAPAGGGEHYVAVLLRDTDGGLPAINYTLFKNDGDPAHFEPVAQLVSTTNLTALALILQRAEDAGLDNTTLERALDAIAGEPAPAGTLAEKLAYVLRGEFSDNGKDEQKELLVRVFPQVAMACGAGWIGKVPSASPTVFELRETVSGRAAGRVTTGTGPLLLPAPGGAAEVPAADPTGHLRVYLNWWTTPSLRDRTPHIGGYHVYRADRENYITETGSPPPANLTPAAFEAAVAAGLIEKVNACPILPDAVFEAAPPLDAPHFFVDDNDTEALSRFDEGGVPFVDGQQMTYYVAACDYFARPGNFSTGLAVKVCDRMPPGTPEMPRAEPAYEGGTHFVKLSWKRAPVEEVGRYFLYCYDTPQEALPDIRHAHAPETPNHIATIDNLGTSARIVFDHTGPGALALPADAGKTRWYSIRAEDTSSCIDEEGFGNISLPSGSVPCSLYGFEALPAPDGYLLTQCCDWLIDLLPHQGPTSFEEVPLRAIRNNPRIKWVEFREVQGDTDYGRYEFDEANSVEITVEIGGVANLPVQFEARFGLDTGIVSDPVQSILWSSEIPEHVWRANLRCGEPEHAPECEGLPFFPLDPGSGKLMPTCGEFVQLPSEHSWRVFRRVGYDGGLSLIASGKFADSAGWCDEAIPATTTTVCYFGQTFDMDGNPSPMVLLGCRHFSNPDKLPIPDIDKAEVLPGANVLAASAPARVTWFCPRPGIERFDLAMHPAPAASVLTFSQGGVEWGLIHSPRLPNGYGADGTLFEFDVDLEKGKQYIARVRARGLAPASHPQAMGIGQWSEMINVLWSPEGETQGGVLPWPTRPVPGVALTSWPAEYDSQFAGFEHGRVAIGAIPASVNVIQSSSETAPSSADVPDLEPYLWKPLPLVVYRHEVGTDARHEMAQSTPMISKFWEPDGNGIIVRTPFISIKKRAGAKASDPYYIWVRDFHPMVANRNYRYTVTCFGGDGEPTGSVTSALLNPSL